MGTKPLSSSSSLFSRITWAVIIVISVVYGIVVLDIAREYSTTPPPLDVPNYKGNLWDSLFSWSVSDELAVGANGAGMIRPNYVKSRILMILHWVGGPITILLGPLQFFDSLRTKWPKAHRLSGYTYMAGGFLSLIGSFGMFAVYDWNTEMYNGYIFSIPLFLLGVISLNSLIQAYVAARNGKYKRHMQWMGISYMTYLTAPWLRLLWIGIPHFWIYLGGSQEEAHNLLNINLLGEPWVVSFLLLMLLLYMTISRNIELVSTTRPIPESKPLSESRKFQIVLFSVIAIAAFVYFRILRFVLFDHDPLFALVGFGTPEEQQQEFLLSRSAWFTAECWSAEDEALLSTPQCASTFANGIYLWSMVTALITGIPALYKSYSSPAAKGNVTRLFLISCITAGQSILFGVISNPRSEFGGLVRVSTLIQEAFCLIFIAGCAWLFFELGQWWRAQRWILYCFAVLCLSAVCKWFLWGFFYYLLSDITLAESLLLSEMLSISVPLIAVFTEARPVDYRPTTKKTN